MRFFGRLDAEKGWTKQLHLGALPQRQQPRPHATVGRDTGYDSIGDWPQAELLGALPRPAGRRGRAAADDRLQRQSGGQLRVGDDGRQLPGRRDRRARSSSAAAGGSWTRRKAMEWQINALSNVGLLSRFVGHDHRLPLVHVLSPPRVLPPRRSATCSAATSRPACCRTGPDWWARSSKPCATATPRGISVSSRASCHRGPARRSDRRSSRKRLRAVPWPRARPGRAISRSASSTSRSGCFPRPMRRRPSASTSSTRTAARGSSRSAGARPARWRCPTPISSRATSSRRASTSSSTTRTSPRCGRRRRG